MNAVLQLLDSLHGDQKPVLVTHSSGNHAQALALSAKTMGLQAHIAMPRNAPPVKKAAVRDYGATIVECGVAAEVHDIIIYSRLGSSLNTVQSFLKPPANSNQKSFPLDQICFTAILPLIY